MFKPTETHLNPTLAYSPTSTLDSSRNIGGGTLNKALLLFRLKRNGQYKGVPTIRDHAEPEIGGATAAK
jgi:hypothetical protein